jgi:predicted nicotinamide N-methyase
MTDGENVLRTSAGEFPLQEYRLGLAGRAWTILHTDAVLSRDDESQFLRERKTRLPYGMVLWPAAIALAHEIIARPDDFRGKKTLELGAGTGLPGIVAATLGARVVQTDRDELALSVCRRNARQNGVTNVECRRADWTDWREPRRYDWILGSDILYGEPVHPHLLHIFGKNLAPDGRILLADPFRAVSLRLLETMEAQGWTIALSKWSVGEEADPRSIGVFELARRE